MKLFIVLSVIACGYAAKLDRTYLPPASASSAGGSPGSLNAPLGQSNGFGSAGAPGLGSSGPAFDQADSSFGKQSGPIGSTGFGQPGAPSYGQSSGNFGSDSDASGHSGFQPQGFGPSSQGNQGSDAFPGQRFQPERAQASADQAAEILRSDSQNDGETYSYNYETSNGIAAEESGVAINGVQAQGGYSYTGDDGQKYRVDYTADENGFQPQGEHLPTPHPIPEEILKSIEENAKAAAAGTQEGAYNPDEDTSGIDLQQYINGAPSSYGQGSSGQNGAASYSQSQGKPQGLYGAPGAGPANGGARPNSARPSGFNQPQYSAGQNQPSQLYGAPNGGNGGAAPHSAGPSGPAFNQPQNSQAAGHSSAQLYGAPNAGAGGNGLTANSARPSSFNQPQNGQGASQLYGAPNSGAAAPNSARPSTGSGFNQPQNGQGQSAQGPSQLYGAPTPGFGGNGATTPNSARPSSSFNQPQSAPSQGPAQLYGSPNAGSTANGGAAANSGRPSSFNQPQASQYSGSNGVFGSSGSSSPQTFGPTKPSQAGSSFNQGNTQAQGEDGYQYNRPQGAQFGGSNQGAAAGGISQASFPRPNGSSQFGGSSPSNQGSNGQYRPQNGFGAQPSGQAGAPAQGSFPRPNGPSQSFGPASGSNGQSSFGGSGQGPAQYQPGQSPRGSMPGQSGYEYNRPGSQPSQGFQPQQGSQQPGSQPSQGFQPQQGSQQPGSRNQPGQGQSFEGPRQPPSFSDEEGYRY